MRRLPTTQHLVAVAVTLAACGGSSEPDRLVTIYEPERGTARARASTVIFVPGIMGSELWNPSDGHVVWGHFWGETGGWSHELVELSLPLAIDQPVTDLTDELAPGGQLLAVELETGAGPIRARGYPGVFEGVVEALVEAGAHHAPEAISLDAIEHDRSPVVGFGYDWRHDLTAEALRLHAVVRAAAEERRRRTGRGRVDLISHSMGTQLVRWYLRYGPQLLAEDGPLPDVTWEGARYVERAIFLGAPNRGEAHALEVMVEGVSVSPVLPTYPPVVVATFPAAYQLLPRVADRRVVWADDGAPVDLFDVDVWERLGWGPFHETQDRGLQALLPHLPDRRARVAALRTHVSRCLRQARRLQEALDRPATPPPDLATHLFVGDTRPTPAVLAVHRETGRLTWRASAPGDGTVTRTSALGQGTEGSRALPTVDPTSVHFVGAEHLGMTGEGQVLNHLLYLLLQAPDPVDRARQAEAAPDPLGPPAE